MIAKSVVLGDGASVPDLEKLLWDTYIAVLGIKRRVYFVKAFVAELGRVTRGKKFHIRNDIVWNTILDARDKCVIDLYSRTVQMRHGVKPKNPKVRVGRAFMSKKGLFAHLRDSHCALLSRAYVPHPDDDVYEIATYTKSRADQFARVFPDCSDDSPSPADIEDLCERFRIHMEPLREDRNKNRAHAHEGDLGTAKMLAPDELESLFDYCESLLQSLSIISSGSVFGGGDMNHASCSHTAVDFVDLVLLGDVADIERVRRGRTRDEAYHLLHEIDDDHQGEQDIRSDRLRFNDRQWDPDFYSA